jgi:hypothetical protein
MEEVTPRSGQRNDLAECELREAWRAVANAKLVEYRKQCWRLAGLTSKGIVDKQTAIDALYSVAVAHALVRSLGDERVEAILAEAFAAADSSPMYAAEVA